MNAPRFRTPSAALAVILAAAAPRAQTVRLLVDVDARPGIGAMDRTGLVVPGIRPGEVFLVLDDGVHGTELWHSDGTAAGTALVVDLTPGAAGSDITWVVAQGTEAWLVVGRGSRQELWRTDGSAAGTTQVLTAAALAASQLSSPVAWLANGDFLLSVDSELWRSDGTVAGTRSLGVPFDALYEVGRGRFFAVSHSTGEVHVTDGTVAGTSLAATGIEFARAALGGLLVGRSNGAASTTVRVLGVAGTPSATVPEPAYAAPGGDAVLLFGTTTVWIWDGRTAPQVLARFRALGDPRVQAPFVARRDGAAMMIIADDGVHGFEPWWTDFTPQGTRLLVDLTPGPASSTIDVVLAVADRILFWAQTPGAGSEPWSTDGTAASTVFVGDLEPGPGDSVPDVFSGVGAILGSRRVVFPIQTTATGFEPWITDGTTVGTRLLADVRPGPGSSTGYFGFSGWPAGTSLVFAADDGVHGREPWVIDLDGAASPLLGGCSSAAVYLVGDPVIGAGWRLSARGVPAVGAALIAQPARAPVDLGARCTLVLDPATSVLLAPITPDPLGRWSTTFPIPNDAGLRGAAFATQAVHLDPTRPLGVELGNAWWLTVGF